jgi:hypothetical protein
MLKTLPLPFTFDTDTPAPPEQVAGALYRTKSTAATIPVSTISIPTTMRRIKTVGHGDEKSGIVLGDKGPRGGRSAGPCSSAPSAPSPCARQPRWSSGGVHCDPIPSHRPVCREARDAETETNMAALPDGAPSTRH